MLEPEPVGDVRKVATVVSGEPVQPEAAQEDVKEPVSKPKKKSRINPAVIIGVVAAIVIIALVLLGPVFGVISFGGEEDIGGGGEEEGLCFGIEECLGQAWGRKESGEFERVYESLERMKEFIYEGDTKGWSHKMCEASELLRGMEDYMTARWYAAQCYDLTLGDPGLADQRGWAEELHRLSEE